VSKLLSFIGIAAVALGIIFMAAGLWVGGTWVFLLAAQVGLPAIISGIVFMAFGYVVELLETISVSLRSANEASHEAAKSRSGVQLRLDDVAGPVRALRSIGDANGGINDKQRAAIVDFVGYCNGGELSKEQRQVVGAWIDTTSGALQLDLENLRHLSPAMLRRFQSAVTSVANTSGTMHAAADRKEKTDAAVARVQSAIAPIAVAA
jgi:hypothetical protein